MGYFKQSLQGVKWMGAFRVISRIVAFIRIAILARVLLPSQFGIFGIAFLMLALLETLTTTGINVVLIQEKDRLKDYLDTAWVISIIRGLVITTFLVLFAPLVADFFNEPESKNILLLIGLVSLIRGFINPSRIRFQKDMEFDKEFLFSGSVLLLDFVVTILLAIILRSPVSLVWGLVAGATLEVILSFAVIRPRPQLKLDAIKARKIVKKGKWVTASGIFGYIFTEGDDVVVGKLLETSSLGIYQVAYKISSLPITEIARVVNQVTFPVFTNIKEDKERLKKAYFKTTTAVSVLSIPIGLFLFIFSRQVVDVVLGENWASAVPILKVLAIFGVIRAITTSSNALFNSVGKQKYVAMYTFVSSIGLMLSIVPLIHYLGLIGAAYAALIGSIVALPIIFINLNKVFK